MRLGPPLNALRVGAQLPFGGVEGIAHGDEEIFMGMFVVVIAVHRHLATGNDELDVDAVEPALFVVTMGRFGDDAASGNGRIDRYQPIEPVADALFGELRGSKSRKVICTLAVMNTSFAVSRCGTPPGVGGTNRTILRNTSLAAPP